jgi:hypothetical protein
MVTDEVLRLELRIFLSIKNVIILVYMCAFKKVVIS